MRNRAKREDWLQDVETRQRNVVFPDTVQNEARLWRNLGNQPWNATTKIGLFVLGIVVFGGWLLIAVLRTGAWVFALAMLLIWGPIFGLIVWATRRALRRIEDARTIKRHKL